MAGPGRQLINESSKKRFTENKFIKMPTFITVFLIEGSAVSFCFKSLSSEYLQVYEDTI